jgi:hypothetical protein
MTCPNCGADQEESIFYCHGCYFLLIDEGDEEAPPPDRGERIIDLARGCENLVVGTWDVATFQSFVSSFSAEQHRRHEALKHWEIPFGLEEDFAEVQDFMYDGMTTCNQGLDVLQRCDGTGDVKRTLATGLELFWKGICLFKEGKQINQRNMDRPLWI